MEHCNIIKTVISYSVDNMDTCPACSRSLNSGRVITCGGSCGQIFHHTCVGLTKIHYSAWSARVGLFWFCESCRLNFNPAVYDRETTILKALRELLIRTDSMDTRLGNYGDNLRTINKTLYGTKQPLRQTNQALDQSTFHQNIDQLNLDDTIDPINRSRSCDETSFFEVLDEVNSTVAQQPDRLVVGNRRVQIISNKQTSSTSQAIASTPAGLTNQPNVPSICEPPSVTQAGSDSTQSNNVNATQTSNGINNLPDNVNSNHPGGSSSGPSTGPLSVARLGRTTDDAVAFYVTPFTPDQKEDDVKQHIHEIVNVDSSLVKVVKLVPRGKSLEDLSFISFKVTVSKAVSNVVGDPWYWPEGVTVRVFDHYQKNGSAAPRPNLP